MPAKKKIKRTNQLADTVIVNPTAPSPRKSNEKTLRALKKAREAKKKYQTLRKEGFTFNNVAEATEIIQKQLSRLSAFDPQSNVAVARLMENIGGDFPTANELAAMSKSEYYKYAGALRSFLGSSLSDPDAVRRIYDTVLSEVVGSQLTKKKNERRSTYYKRRQRFIDEHEETAKKAFELYRMLEETHAGVILRGKLSPMAYGSDNLITDLFDFVENDYDGDRDQALDYWREQLSAQYQWEEQELANATKGSKKLTKFDWKGRESYASFVARQS